MEIVISFLTVHFGWSDLLWLMLVLYIGIVVTLISKKSFKIVILSSTLVILIANTYFQTHLLVQVSAEAKVPGRFVVGLLDHVKILQGEELKEYVGGYIKDHFKTEQVNI
ncbi:MAG: hypothetical protein ACI3ZL_03525 [Candidatus Cryptobacteroides sp.]